MRRSLPILQRSLISLQRFAQTLMTHDKGQGMTEYALILALIAIIAVAALTLLGGKITSALSTVSNSLVR
jgi:pilus assembly protein Flp/PilA